jgi:hypothetical protein
MQTAGEWARTGFNAFWRRERPNGLDPHGPRSRLWLNDGSCVWLRPLCRNRVWSFDFVQAQTHDGWNSRILTLIDDLTRSQSKGQPDLPDAEGGAAYRQRRRDRGCGRPHAPARSREHIRCDNGLEMISKALRRGSPRSDRRSSPSHPALRVRPGTDPPCWSCFSLAPRARSSASVPPLSAPVAPGHGGVDRGLVDEHEVIWIEVGSALRPRLPHGSNTRPVLLGRMARALFREMPWRSK